MTAPRQYLKGTTYLVTRRCSQRHFFLRPSRLTNDTFRFLLAVATRRYGIRLHAFCVLSNHFHLVVTDPQALLPRCMQYLDGLVARALNASIDRWEDFWAPPSHSAVALVSPSDIVSKTAYTLANPVAAGLVRSASQWPGLWSAPESMGGPPVLVKRPVHFFNPKGALPESTSLELTVPPGFPSDAAWREQVAAALALQESEAVRKSTGFLGILKVLSQQPFGRPKVRDTRRRLSPRVASMDKWKRIEVLGRLKAFATDYRMALSAWRQGHRSVFPEGTFLMRVLHGAPCAGAG